MGFGDMGTWGSMVPGVLRDMEMKGAVGLSGVCTHGHIRTSGGWGHGAHWGPCP